MSTPIWASGARNPWILYPSVLDTVVDFGFVSGSFGTAWNKWNPVMGAGSSAAMVTGEGEMNGNAVKMIKAAGTLCYIQNQSCHYLPYLPVGTGQSMVQYFRMKCKSVSGTTPSFFIRTDWYNSAGASISTATQLLVNIGVDLAADNTWVVKRGTMGTVPANAVAMASLFGSATGGTSAFEVYVDWFTCGFDCNFADMGPSRKGAFIADTLPLRRPTLTRRQRAANGSIEQQRWNAGLREVDFSTTPIDDTGRTVIKSFTDQASQGVPFSLFLNQSDFSGYNSILRGRATKDQDGIAQIGKTPYHRWNYGMEQVKTP